MISQMIVICEHLAGMNISA